MRGDDLDGMASLNQSLGQSSHEVTREVARIPWERRRHDGYSQTGRGARSGSDGHDGYRSSLL